MNDAEIKAKRRPWVFHVVGTLLAITTFSAVGLITSYRLSRSRQQAQQRAAVAAVEALGGEAQLVYSSTLAIRLSLEEGDAPNLFFLNSKNVTDDDLRLFESAPTTRGIHLFNNRITDAGLAHLENLSNLDLLDLRRNNITDAGLVHLEHLQKLQNLYLLGTNVTPVGVTKLQKKLPNTKISH
jgi:Leucine-rich repeat (LRR) protein